MCDRHHLYPLSRERPADLPLPSLNVEFALAIEFQHPGILWVFPARRIGVVAAQAGTPAHSGSLHIQRFMRSHIVMFPAIRIQPRLWVVGRKPTSLQGALQRAMEAFDFALSLRMPKSAPVQPDPLTH